MLENFKVAQKFQIRVKVWQTSNARQNLANFKVPPKCGKFEIGAKIWQI